jgi:hypothetical protein
MGGVVLNNGISNDGGGGLLYIYGSSEEVTALVLKIVNLAEPY